MTTYDFMTRFAQGSAITHYKPEVWKVREWKDVMGVQTTAALIAILASVVIALEYGSTPFGIFPMLAYAILLCCSPAFPVGGFFWIAPHPIRSAILGTKSSFSVFWPLQRTLKGVTAPVANFTTGATTPVRVTRTTHAFKETFTRAVFTAALPDFTGEGFKPYSALFAGATHALSFVGAVAGVGAKLSLFGRGITEALTAELTGCRYGHSSFLSAKDRLVTVGGTDAEVRWLVADQATIAPREIIPHTSWYGERDTC